MIDWNNINLCLRLINAYATNIEGLTKEECTNLGFNDEQCSALMDTFTRTGNSWPSSDFNGSRVTEQEQQRLQTAQVNADVISCLGTNEGTIAFRRRAEWLSASCLDTNYDPQTRARMMEELGLADADFSVPSLTQASKDENAGVRLAAVKALILIANMRGYVLTGPSRFISAHVVSKKAILQPIIEALKDEDVEVRRWAASMFPMRFVPFYLDDEVVLAFTEALKDEEVRLSAVEQLVHMGADAVVAVPMLIETLKNEEYDPGYMSQTASALASIGSPAIPLLKDAFISGNMTMRKQLMGVIQSMHYAGQDVKDTLPMLIAELNQTEMISDIFEVGKYVVAPFFSPLVNLFGIQPQSMFADYRAGIVDILGYIYNGAVVNYTFIDCNEVAKSVIESVLIEALSDWNESVQIAAIKAFQQYHSNATDIVVHGLIRAVNDSNPRVQLAAIRALGRLNAKDSVPVLMEVSKDEALHDEAVLALCRIPDVRALPLYIEEVKSDRSYAAAYAIKDLGSEGRFALPTLIQALEKVLERQDYDWNDQRFGATIADVLGELGVSARGAIPVLTKAMNNWSEYHGIHAFRALEKIGGNELSPEIKAAMQTFKTTYDRRSGSGFSLFFVGGD